MENLVQLQDQHFIADLMYARRNNMLGAPVYREIGFGNTLLMHPKVAEALMSLVPILEKNGLKMRICDAYRPPLAHQRMVEIIPIKGFFKSDYRESNHCHGTAIDVCLTDLNGKNLRYPCQVDAYAPRFQKQVANGDFNAFQQHLAKARHDFTHARPEAVANREFLKQLMESHGFESIPHEWWHYNIQGWQQYPVVEWDR
ncbi:MAG: hypothetical protein J6Y91_01460 [Alphaproteobacteria bacterium]|nr:hypothetical protein [Alphaproteobacteria bacterium]